MVRHADEFEFEVIPIPIALPYLQREMHHRCAENMWFRTVGSQKGDLWHSKYYTIR